jgi:hypothetical protein
MPTLASVLPKPVSNCLTTSGACSPDAHHDEHERSDHGRTLPRSAVVVAVDCGAVGPLPDRHEVDPASGAPRQRLWSAGVIDETIAAYTDQGQ